MIQSFFKTVFKFWKLSQNSIYNNKTTNIIANNLEFTWNYNDSIFRKDFDFLLI